MPEADAQNWYLFREMADEIERDTRFVGSAGSRRQDDLARSHLFDLFQSHLIVATDLHLFSSLPNVLNEVEGERVVIVKNEDHDQLLSC